MNSKLSLAPSTPPFIHATAIVEENATLGNGTKVWHFVHIRSGARIGFGCILGKNVYVDTGVQIGNHVKIQNNVSVFRGVEIEEGVFIGPHVCFTNDLRPRAIYPNGSIKTDQDWKEIKTLIRRGASLGANATLVAGIVVGEWAMIGAGSVVTHDVPPYALAYGNPARIQGTVNSLGEVISHEYRPDLCE